MSSLVRSLFSGGMPKAALFDLDGTLVDSARDLTLAVDAMLAAMGRPAAGEDNVRSWIGNGANMLVRRALAGTSDPATVALVPEAVAVQAQLSFRDAYARVNGRAAVLYPFVVEALDTWAALGIRMAVVTNKPRPFAEPLLHGLGIADRFVLVIGGECLPQKKPHPQPLLHAAAELGVEPADCLMVGDSSNDVGAAHAAGMRVICRRGGYNHGEDIALSRPDAVFDCFTELR
jgi:phosphoglycolate phosphatase